MTLAAIFISSHDNQIIISISAVDHLRHFERETNRYISYLLYSLFILSDSDRDERIDCSTVLSIFSDLDGIPPTLDMFQKAIRLILTDEDINKPYDSSNNHNHDEDSYPHLFDVNDFIALRLEYSILMKTLPGGINLHGILNH